MKRTRRKEMMVMAERLRRSGSFGTTFKPPVGAQTGQSVDAIAQERGEAAEKSQRDPSRRRRSNTCCSSYFFDTSVTPLFVFTSPPLSLFASFLCPFFSPLSFSSAAHCSSLLTLVLALAAFSVALFVLIYESFLPLTLHSMAFCGFSVIFPSPLFTYLPDC